MTELRFDDRVAIANVDSVATEHVPAGPADEMPELFAAITPG
jgi:hypothetical protein